jgi:hypothetical protein
MKRILLAGTTAAIVATSGHAIAQNYEQVIIERGYQPVIREYVMRERIAPVAIQEHVVVGTSLPSEVQLRPVPTAWGPWAPHYRYFYSNENVYIVEPRARRVVRIIEGF